jgi:hypothetical protein
VQDQNGSKKVHCKFIDFYLLENLISDNVDQNNIYKSFNWTDEISKFWGGVELLMNNSHTPPPLFAYALLDQFKPIKRTLKLDHIISDALKFKNIEELIDDGKQLQQPVGEKATSNANQRHYRVTHNTPIKLEAPYQQEIYKNLEKTPVSEVSSLTDRSRVSYKQRNEDVNCI